MAEDFYFPGPAHRILQPFIRRPAFIFQLIELTDHGFTGMHLRCFQFIFTWHFQTHLQNIFITSTEQCQCTMRWNFIQCFIVFKVIGKLFAFVLFAFNHLRFNDAVLPQIIPQLLQQIRFFRKLFH